MFSGSLTLVTRYAYLNGVELIENISYSIYFTDLRIFPSISSISVIFVISAVSWAFSDSQPETMDPTAD